MGDSEAEERPSAVPRYLIKPTTAFLPEAWAVPSCVRPVPSDNILGFDGYVPK